MSARSFDLNKVNKTQSNIRVTEENGTKTVLLHGHAIVKIESNKVILSSCGWLTSTTKTGINNALKQLGLSDFQVSQKKGLWFIDGKPFYDGYEVKRMKVIESMNELKQSIKGA